MNPEPHKSNIVLIMIAIIGVIGTVIGATITVIGNYNVEKLRQETELTRIALVSIATQGGATQMVLQSTINAPTELPAPTYTPFPTLIPEVATPTLEPVIIGKDENPAGNTTHKRFDINLPAGESIVGQSWELITIQSSGQKIYAPCVAYLFEGPGQYSFSIIAGYWYHYQNVTPSIDEALLQGMVDSLVGQKCPSNVKVVHLP